MARNRFTEKLKFLHFVDNSNYNANDANRDKLYKVRGVVEFLVDQFKNVYISTQHISIDEELLLWKGRLLFKQYIPSKRSRFEVKLFSLCEDSGYLWNSFVYLKKINYLYENQTCATGTTRKHRMQFSFRRNKNLLVLPFQDKKEMYMLSIMHKAVTLNVVEETDVKTT